MKKFLTIFDITYTGVFVALMTIGAKISIPTPIVVITFQLAFACLGSLILGVKRTVIGLIVYTLMGLVGIPVFATGGGFAYAIAPSFGYVLGFIFAGLVTSLIVEYLYKKKPFMQKSATAFPVLIGLALLNLTIVNLIGIPYLFMIKDVYMDVPFAQAALTALIVSTIPKDAALVTLAAFAAVKLRPALLAHNVVNA
ncbi:MAG: biotin transporter BioY [Christensenellaceae bacterium]|jgi:biotin transport system substrate-specific component|nr:biotin transporter BioY [Christensenellaceae bacterium]